MKLPHEVVELPGEIIVRHSTWRHFAAAILAADWVSYPAEVDRVDRARLNRVLSQFPGGFRLWGIRPAASASDESLEPMGYTGWHPIPRETFELLLGRPQSVARFGFELPIAPLRSDEANYLYLFNYSVAPWLVGSGFARPMLEAYAADLAAVHPAGMAAITVSPHGARVAARFGLHLTGSLTVKGMPREVFAARIP